MTYGYLECGLLLATTFSYQISAVSNNNEGELSDALVLITDPSTTII